MDPKNDAKNVDAKMEGERKVKVFSVLSGDWGKGFRFHEGAIMLAMRKGRGGTVKSRCSVSQ